MATMVVEPVFVDTNNLIYAQQAHSPFNAHAIAIRSHCPVNTGRCVNPSPRTTLLGQPSHWSSKVA
jgi:hypothetical protein